MEPKEKFMWFAIDKAKKGIEPHLAVRIAADVLDRQRIDDRAAPSLLPLLQEMPGVATARTGQTGLQGSVFIRGGESRYARVLGTYCGSLGEIRTALTADGVTDVGALESALAGASD